ncbi:DUF4260 domain-containing protein [Terriglobus saanensis]|uniref:DUF4260 domain-containing protein n=1 Tax=Terriglobus saanensis (strain ATCC BAA-1853 / DSM 23119 / SP1PR4) TaxID=401053 RepID=E8UZA5_TERSS|nr:DUF4260 domain-containing protein [Terriglobus saanensis]ADV82123.1 hypothetical protein AciPR4_1299 [Terriglobus saanensis SP1PR4]
MTNAPEEFRGAARGGVRTLLRLEGLAVLLGSVFFFKVRHGNWGIFALLFFAPDLSFVLYAIDRKLATASYNAAHSYLLPVALLCVGVLHPAVMPYALIWTAHIGFDRALGYGLKYKTGFGDTHLGKLGKIAT